MNAVDASVFPSEHEIPVEHRIAPLHQTRRRDAGSERARRRELARERQRAVEHDLALAPDAHPQVCLGVVTDGVIKSQRLKLPCLSTKRNVAVMHMHVQLKLDELRGPPTLGSL